MAPTSDEEDFLQSFGIKCVEMCNALANQRLAFKFSLTFGRFSFNMDTTEMRSPPAQLPQKKAKRKSKSAKIRDMRRRREFLERKEAALSSSVSQAVPDIFSSVASWETGDPSQVDIPRSEAAQRHTDPKNPNPSGIRLRLEKSASGVWSSSPSVSRRNSSSQPDPVPECSNCSKPFLLNHQCDNNYDVDEDDYFDIEKEIDEIDDKYKKILLRRAEEKCDCSVHSTLNNGHSPKAKKPRNQKYPKDCNLIKLRKGEIELMDFSVARSNTSCQTQ